jgi:hypothetical protein
MGGKEFNHIAHRTQACATPTTLGFVSDAASKTPLLSKLSFDNFFKFG